MIMQASPILDSFGRPLPKRSRVRQDLAEALDRQRQLKQRQQAHGSYDAARDTDEHRRYWANADALDADSANSPHVRSKLVQRSRYEVWNNGYADGIAATYTNDLVGIGPTLRMQTASEAFNRMVEAAWWRWSKAVQLRRKLWCMAHAKHTDGEAFAVLRENRNLRDAVKIDLVLHETEQCATPYLPFGTKGKIDGIEFDDFGNPTYYEFLKEHPGSSNGFGLLTQSERVPAKYVLHWFRMRRPGQHRGIPETTSTLNAGAAGRRWRESVVSASENIASHPVFLKTQFEPEEMDMVAPMSTMEYERQVLTALPSGHGVEQLKAEQPTANHEMFMRSLINEQARPKNMPFNKAACDSSSYNYASGRLDHQTYYGSLDIDRADCNDVVLDQLFAVWFEMAVVTYGWFGGNPEAVDAALMPHEWDWPKHQAADIVAEADASDKRLKNGTTSLTSEYSASGLDYEDELIEMAAANGVDVDTQRKINMLLNLPQHVLPAVVSLLGLNGTESGSGGADDGVE
jgi:capsid protein